jgi:hypothetical protein
MVMPARLRKGWKAQCRRSSTCRILGKIGEQREDAEPEVLSAKSKIESGFEPVGISSA